MRRVLLALIGLTCLVGPNVKGDSAGCLQGQNFTPVPFASEKITVSTSALPFTASVYAPAGVPKAFVAVFTTETDTLRFQLDGTVPTSSVGMQVVAGSSVTVCQGSIPKFKAIRSGSSDVPINVTYFNTPQ